MIGTRLFVLRQGWPKQICSGLDRMLLDASRCKHKLQQAAVLHSHTQTCASGAGLGRSSSRSCSSVQRHASAVVTAEGSASAAGLHWCRGVGCALHHML